MIQLLILKITQRKYKQMKLKLIHIFTAILVVFFIQSCQMEGIDDDTSFLENLDPNGSTPLFNITTDNSGLVTIFPKGEGYTSYDVAFGDGSSQTGITTGTAVTHHYNEGTYSVVITYNTLNGSSENATYPLQITYVAPTNVSADLSFAGTLLNLSATANYANGFTVNWGDGSAIQTLSGTYGNPFTGSHNYAAGNYTITVNALSGGAASTSQQYTVTVFNPFGLPITYQDPFQNYNVGGTFGGISVEQVTNPFQTGINTSTMVRKYTKSAGAANWSGTWTPLSEPNGAPINISNGGKIKVMIYATEVGKKLNVELEQASGGLANQVLKVPVTVANQWEELVFDFGALGIPAGTTFKQLVFRYDDVNNGSGEIIYLDNIKQTN